MKPSSLVLVSLAALLLGAHLLRGGHLVLAVALALSPALLALRAVWAARVLQVALAVGTLEWVRTLVELVDLRRALGLPYTRLALILGAVALTTGLAALLVPARSDLERRAS